MQYKILVSAGEVSGDEYGAEILSEMQSANNTLSIRGMGGHKIKRISDALDIDFRDMGAPMGFLELASSFGKIVKAQLKMRTIIKEWKPDLLLLIDYPDFNLRLAKYAKRYDIPVMMFVSPTVWAWRRSRVKTLRRCVDELITILPFERKFLREHGVEKVYYFGNPKAYTYRNHVSGNSAKEKEEFLSRHNLSDTDTLIAVFPGSRTHELKKHLPIVRDTIKVYNSRFEKAIFLISVADQSHLDTVRNYLQDIEEVRLISGEGSKILSFSHVGLIKSGTSNLEAALGGLPFVMFFKASFVSEIIVRLLVGKRDFSIVNILRKGTVKERLQREASPAILAEDLHDLLHNKGEREKQLANFQKIREDLMPNDENIIFSKTAKIGFNLLKTREKSRSETHIYKPLVRSLAYVKPYTGILVTAVICMIVFGASDGLIPILLKAILDGVFLAKDRAMLYAVPFVVVGFMLIRALADFGQQYLIAKLGHRIVMDLRNQINSKILRLPSSFFRYRSPADMISRITSDTTLVKAMLTEAIPSVIRDSIRILALVIAAFTLDPILATIALIVFPLGMIPIYRFGKKMRRLSREGQSGTGRLSAMLNESIVGQKVVKAFGRQEWEEKRFNKRNRELTETFIKGEKIKALIGPINEILASFAIAGILVYGGVSVIGGVRTQGEFIAFLAALFLLYDPFKRLSRVSAIIQQGLAGAERIFELIDSYSEASLPHQRTTLKPPYNIEIDNVTYIYAEEEREKIALKDVSLYIPEGSKVALVGRSGAGKSTLADLIPRFIEPTRGRIKIGGIDIRQVSPAELRSKIAIVSQHTFLFNDTIYNNIAYGREGCSRRDVEEAAKAANAYDFIVSLKDGFDTVIGEGGYSLSGGERQRLAIARAILKDAPILILDEATASLDSHSEELVQRALEVLERDRTCLIIAHRLSTVRSADYIAVLRDGRIIEVGDHNDLLKRSGEYFELYKLQFCDQYESAGKGTTA